MSIDIKRTARSAVPRVPYEQIAKRILGAKYALSLVLTGNALATRMNREHRKKTYSPNVLSFPLSKTEGEIFLNIQKAKQEAKKFKVTFQKRLAFLFIHACLHLKGLDHGDKMDQLEQVHLKKARF